MPRIIRLAAAQMGRTDRSDPRAKTLARMIKLLESAAAQSAEVVLFPETAFTTFFPRYLIDDATELESWFERGDITTAPNTKALFDKAHELGVDVSVGFAEATDDGEHFNTCIYYHAKTGSVLSKYRKIHLPGTFEPFADPHATNQLEKRYFQPGNLGFNAFRVPDLVVSAERGEAIFGMMICNDRRWAEAWRALSLQGVEVVLCGYNTPGFAPHLFGSDPAEDGEKAAAGAMFHHKLTMQAHSYTNATFSVCAARCGVDDGKYGLIAGSMIVSPEGHILAEATSVEDEVIAVDCDLDLCIQGKTKTFDFGRHRRVEHYQRLTEQTGVKEPPRLGPSGKNDNKANDAPLPINGTASNGVAGTPTPAVQSNGIPHPTEQMRILLINPNATAFMTSNCVAMVQQTLPPDVSVTGFTAPQPAPTAIEGNFDSVMSASACMRALIPMAAQYDAFLVACYSDHALIRMLREEVSGPVIGIMEASLFAARTLGNRFGLIATSRRSRVMNEDAIRHYGFDGFCVGVGSCDLGVLELESKSQAEVLGVMCGVARELVAKGADTLTLGCAGMTEMKRAVEEAVGDEVQVIDGVVAGVQHLVGMVRMGGRTAKAGLYASSAVGRKARGQDYY